MGRMAYALRLIAGLVMAVAVVLAYVSMSDTMDNLGRPQGERTLGVLFLIAFACFLIAFLSAGILWVLTDISQQLELSRKPIAANSGQRATESKG
jgi:hypothetical protein